MCKVSLLNAAPPPLFFLALFLSSFGFAVRVVMLLPTITSRRQVESSHDPIRLLLLLD